MDGRAWQRLSVRKEAKVCKKSICRLFLSCAQAMHKEKRRKLLGPSPNRMSIASACSPSLTDKSIFCTERGPLEQKTSELIDLKSLFIQVYTDFIHFSSAARAERSGSVARKRQDA